MHFDHSIFDAMPPAAILDADGVIVDTNTAWRSFGSDNGGGFDGIGLNYLLICDAATGDCSEGSFEAAAGIRAVLAGQTEFNHEYPCHGPDVERWYNMRVTRFMDDGQLRVLVVHQNVTRWKLNEKALSESESRYRLLAENVVDMISRHAPTGEYRYVSPACHRLLGYTPDELIGRSPFDLLLAEDHPTLDQIFEAARQGQPATAICRFLHRDGHALWVETSAKVMTDAAGNIELICVSRDITERKRMELRAQEELERRVEERTADLRIANEEVKRFAYIVSHDLRAPLINIQGFVTELRSSLATVSAATEALIPQLDEAQREEVCTALNDDIPEAFDFIQSAVRRMDHFINAILKLSRLGRRELHLEDINTEVLVEDVLKSLAHQIVESKTMVTLGELPNVVADRVALEQIFANILTNAVLYLDPNRAGAIDMCGERNERETIFRISDNGRGIAAEDAHKVFEPFRRAGRQDVPGEGMGLAYVQTLIRRHGGRIWFDSEPHVGTMFSFSIPNDLSDGDYDH